MQRRTTDPFKLRLLLVDVVDLPHEATQANNRSQIATMDIDSSTVASVATCVGVFVAAWQLWRTARHTQTGFEDCMNREYRELVKELPVDAMLGKTLDEAKLESEEVRSAFYNYMDLSNEQVFLRSKGRVCKATWAEWRAGIKYNLSLPAFGTAWEEFKKQTSSLDKTMPLLFGDLRKLETSGFKLDPAQWWWLCRWW